MSIDPHRLAELRSLAFHRAVAEKIRTDETVIQRARSKAEEWQTASGRSSGAAHEWCELLAGSVDSICAFLVEESERAMRLRQSTPFAGAIDPRERWRIWREVRERST